jgi:hypothetical protein
MTLAGWKSGRMMRRFAAVTDQTLRAAAEAVSGQNLIPIGSMPAAATCSHPVGARRSRIVEHPEINARHDSG